MAESHRQQRVAERIRKILSGELSKGNFSDAVLDRQPITLTHVDPSPDLRHAKVYFTALGGVALVSESEIKDALSRHKTRLQAALGRQLTMKFTPKLTFIADDAFDKADHMNLLIQGLPQAS
ncbi:MAG: 30S ribosome-binding factor RbfA [Pseudomonadota bacterium]|nr:30S ribosome-binding factor RbfA [Pseudomonadota bacterium]